MPRADRCDPTVRVWDVASGTLVHELHGHSAAVKSAAFSPDGKYIVTASDDWTVRLWEVSTGQSLAQVRSDGSAVDRVIFSPDGARIAATNGRTVYLWLPPTSPLRSGGEDGGQDDLLVLRGHGNDVSSVAFSPDARRVLTGSWDGTARVWDMAGLRQQLAEASTVEELVALAQTRAGRALTEAERKEFLYD